eukprot:CAMPEP_0117624244 /NCGR_PEP_ID=MMETSP0802-20121206/270_1 /TAXON_ID=38833 /ORGANISM="Micromonas sp., Strain CCMP2099" /LENGTH=107 /DNA_ID=CAMNT_0005428257 /DNA_START=58 /DNA_END=380 /DNA_ORIENTATION=-
MVKFSIDELRRQMDLKHNIRNMSVIAHVDHVSTQPKRERADQRVGMIHTASRSLSEPAVVFFSGFGGSTRGTGYVPWACVSHARGAATSRVDVHTCYACDETPAHGA